MSHDPLFHSWSFTAQFQCGSHQFSERINLLISNHLVILVAFLSFQIHLVIVCMWFYWSSWSFLSKNVSRFMGRYLKTGFVSVKFVSNYLCFKMTLASFILYLQITILPTVTSYNSFFSKGSQSNCCINWYNLEAQASRIFKVKYSPTLATHWCWNSLSNEPLL